MMKETEHEIFLVSVPGLENLLRREAIEKGFKKPTVTKGGVTILGGWSVAWRANLELRGASRVLVRIGSFKVQHLSQLDKKARAFDWLETLRSDIPVRIDVSCKKSSIYHEKAAQERIERALTESHGIEVSAEADVCLKVRILENICTFSIDTSGEGLHKRGHKEALNKAPMRETLASLLLRYCEFDPTKPFVDPMCGSGTFVIEAAEMAANLKAGRTRSFAFEQLATFDAELWHKMKSRSKECDVTSRFYGFDRDAGAIKISCANAKRAGVNEYCRFEKQTIGSLVAPKEQTGLVIINPPYGVRLGDTKKLLPLYQSLGQKLKQSFSGWRVGLVTNNSKLARATTLPFETDPLGFSHGGIHVKCYKTAVLP